MKRMATQRANRSLTLKDMTGGSGCTPRTVRYYERQGLLQATRTTGGHRLFAPGELDRLNFIISLREAGWSLEEITVLLNTRAAALTDRDARRQLDQALQGQIKQIEQKLDVLTRLQEDLKQTRKALAACEACTETTARVSGCETCPRLPAVAELPHGFRLTWRSDEARRTGPACNGRSLRVHDGDGEIDVDG